MYVCMWKYVWTKVRMNICMYEYKVWMNMCMYGWMFVCMDECNNDGWMKAWEVWMKLWMNHYMKAWMNVSIRCKKPWMNESWYVWRYGCMNLCTDPYIHVFMCAHMHMKINVWMITFVHKNMEDWMHAYMNAKIHFEWKNGCVRVSTNACMYEGIYVWMN